MLSIVCESEDTLRKENVHKEYQSILFISNSNWLRVSKAKPLQSIFGLICSYIFLWVRTDLAFWVNSSRMMKAEDYISDRMSTVVEMRSCQVDKMYLHHYSNLHVYLSLPLSCLSHFFFKYFRTLLISISLWNVYTTLPFKVRGAGRYEKLVVLL